MTAKGRSLVSRLRGGVYGINRIRLCAEAADRIEYLENRLAERDKDAERYRWIREHPTFIGWDSDYRPDEVDKAVQIAIDAERNRNDT